MTTRNTAVGSKSSSDFLTAANYNDGAGGQIGKASITTNQTGITTAVDVTNLTLTLTPNASRTIEIAWQFTAVSNTSGDNCILNVVKDGSIIDFFQYGASTVDNLVCVSGRTIDQNPTNASHTYKLNFGRTGSSGGTWTIKGANPGRGWLWVYDVGPNY